MEDRVWPRIRAGKMIAILALLLSCVQPVLAVSLQGSAHAGVQPPITQLIVKFKAPAVGAGVTVSAADFAMTPTRLQTLSAAAGVPLTFKRAMSGNAQVVKLPYAMNLQDADGVAARLKTLANVQYAVPDRWLSPATAPTPNDTDYSKQWYLTDPASNGVYWGAADLPGAWNITTGSPSVVVGVVDTGVLNHADLAANLVGGSAATSGYDMVSIASPANSGDAGSNDGDGRDSNPTDPGDWANSSAPCYDASHPSYNDSSWHGTHVSGIIGAVGNNSLGITGINWTTQILMVRALGVCGGQESDVVDALTWAAGGSVSGVPANTHPAKVINLSLGGPGSCDPAMQSAIDSAVNSGVTVVVAAGNSSADVANTAPASCNNVITVAAVGPSGDLTYYSNYDTAPNHIIALAAPGGEMSYSGDPNGIYSTYDSGTTTAANDSSYGYEQGTSMATPVVTGTIALMLAADPALTDGTVAPAKVSGVIKHHLEATARAFPTGTGHDCTTTKCGAGIVDAAAAVTSVTTPPVANAGASQTIFASSGTDTLDGSASSDPYGTISSYVWTQTGGASVALTGANTAKPSFTAPTTAPQTLTFQLTVTNDVGLTSTSSVTVNVTVGPVITGFNPTNTDVLGPGFTLTVNGVDFNSASVVYWNGTAVPTTYVSATQLTAQISKDDLLEPGGYPVTVVNTAQTSKAVPFAVVIPNINSGSGGGGAMNPVSLLVLAALALVVGRRRRAQCDPGKIPHLL